MDTPRLLLILSTIAFAAAVVQALFALRSGSWKESRWHIIPMALGFIMQTGFLYLRGQARGRCPLTNQFEVFLFIGWCIVLLYFLVPRAPVRAGAAVFGGVVAAVLFGWAKRTFVWYITLFSSYQLVYGTLALVPITDVDPAPQAVEVQLVATASRIEYLPGKSAEVWAFRDGAKGGS